MAISVTIDQRDALQRARHVCLLDTPSQLLRAALDGDQSARRALVDAWPGDTGAKSNRVRLDPVVHAELVAKAPEGRNGRPSATAGITQMIKEWNDG